VIIAEKHPYSTAVNGYRVSPYLQERIVYAGQSDVYGACNDLINKFLRIDINPMQVHRLTNTYGEMSVGLVEETEAETLLHSLSANEVVYAELDGSMILTRENSWQEVKVGRIFKQSDILKTSAKRQEVRSSLYTAQFGHYENFINHFEKQVDVFDRLNEHLVFLTDGATWIRHWISDNYPKATQVLDYTHGVEHIASWLEFVEKDKKIRKEQLLIYKKVLLEQGIEPIVEMIKQTNTDLKTVKEEKRKVLNYLTTNAYRMNYPEYIKREICIGSGAIEASHRTVVQQRMKRSGQRWTERRIQNMLNIKVVKLSGHWDKVVNLIRETKKAA
jgi:hypothetical protein